MVESQATGSPCRDTGITLWEAVTSHPEWRLRGNCLAKGFWNQTETGPSELFCFKDCCSGIVPEAGTHRVPAARERQAVFLIGGEAGGAEAVLMGPAPRLPRTTSILAPASRPALLH